MATASVTNTFVNFTPADADAVNENFGDVVEFLNNSVLHLDGSKQLTGNVDANSHKVVNLASGTATTDAANVANVVASIPPGTITMYGGSTAPSLWLLCDGSAVSRVTYAALFAAIGTAFGVGDGSTTFNLPNFQDKYPIGDSGTLTLGATVGSNDAVVVTHNHTQNSHGHTIGTLGVSGSVTGAGSHEHSFAFNTLNSGTFEDGNVTSDHGGSTVGTYSGTTTGGGGHTHGLSVSLSGTVANATATNIAAGVSGTNANRPSSVVVNYIIRTGV